ncbi:hypothetical protein FisN_3Lh046 [Fistulifera solaris]|uniref:Uncharacterized protein n=1 Tax=Fistulifera solaris TaxID=1519565 RepID=A0A1Z5JYK6_FISSO|nr:hypothetical protein FisN_3Lh046 [Fistulifera solaris]|eukprot:GAX19107.1 hypothetical protein FisN_3Lh046 [Fistulifera solaris]
MERKRNDSNEEEGRTVKRRRTAILDAFQSISLTRESPQREESMSTTASSYFDDVGNNDEEDDDESDVGEAPLLSDREEVERQVMFDLAFGRPTGTRRHPVDEKVEEWIRRDYLMRQRFERYISPSTPHQDDMHLDHGSVYREQSGSSFSPEMVYSSLQRSQSLSDLKQAVDDSMDIDMTD